MCFCDRESVWEASAALAGVRVSDDLKAATRWCRCVDLGCGTGLMGPLLRPHCGQLCGVDLSVGMLDKARQRGCYDDLAAGELVQYLQVAQQGNCCVVAVWVHGSTLHHVLHGWERAVAGVAGLHGHLLLLRGWFSCLHTCRDDRVKGIQSCFSYM